MLPADSPEDRPASSPIGSVSAEDADGDSLTFQLTGRDSNFFEIVTLYTDSLGYYGQIKIKEYGLPDFDALKDSYEIKTDIPNNPGEYVILEIEVIVSDGVSSSSKTFNPAIYNDVWDDPIIDDYDVSTPIDINSDPNEIFENSFVTQLI